MKKKILSAFLVATLTLGVFATPASAFTGKQEGFYLAALSDVEYSAFNIGDTELSEKTKTLSAESYLGTFSAESFDALYDVFADPETAAMPEGSGAPEGISMFALNYPAVNTELKEVEGTEGIKVPTTSAITEKTNLAMVIVGSANSTDGKEISVSNDILVSERSAQIALKDFDATVTLKLADGKTIKVSDGGKLLLSNDSPSVGNQCNDMQLKVVLTEPIEVSGKDSALYLEPSAGLSPEALGQLGYEYARDVIVAPSGQPAIVISDGGEVRGSRYDIVRADGDEATDVPLIEVQDGELRLSSGSPSRVNDTEDGMPVYSDDPDASMYHEDPEFVMNLDNGASTSPAVSVAEGAQATIEGGSITGSGDTPLIEVAEGATLTISGENTTISTESATQPAIEVAGGGTIVYEDNKATVTTGTENEKAVTLAPQSKVRMGSTEVTVSNETEGDNYVDNNGIAVFSAGATSGKNGEAMNPAVLLSDGTLIEGTENQAPGVTTNEVTGETTVAVPAGGSVTEPGKSEVVFTEAGTVEQSSDGETTIPVSSITLDRNFLTLYSNRPSSVKLNATVNPANAGNSTVAWSSSNESVVKVDNNGMVTPVANGTATITATAGGKSATCTVYVTTYIPPANPNYRITIGDTANGTVTANPTAAKAGATVTLTATPDEGYAVGTLTVTDRFGDAVKVTEQADGTYTFVMPNGQVTVDASFVQVEEPVPTEPFTDVDENDWFYDEVVYVYANGLMDGVGDNRFAPNTTTNRAMLATILYRLAGEPDVSGDLPFTDVAAGQWYTDAVLWAAQNDIVNGVGENTFAPSNDLTREQLVTMLYRYAEAEGYDVSAAADLSGYPDAGQVQTYAQKAMSWAVAESIVEGMDGNLNPAGNATRAQIATILMRFCENVVQ